MLGKKLTVITGVTSGLGRAMTEEFVERGHTVLGCGRSEAKIAQLKRIFRKPHDSTRWMSLLRTQCDPGQAFV